MAGATGNWYGGLDELHEMGFIGHALGEGDLFVDVGANIGSYSILASSGCGCHVVAFEPSTGTRALLERNVRVNNLHHLVEIHGVALGAEAGVVRFSTDSDTTNHVLLEPSPGHGVPATEDVPIKTLDEVLGGRFESTTKVLKIDVEGFELNVLRGAKRTLQSDTLLAVILEINGSAARYSSSDQEVLDFMHGLGFTSFRYDALTRVVNGPATDVVRTSENVLFTRDLYKVQRALEIRKTFRLKVASGYV